METTVALLALLVHSFISFSASLPQDKQSEWYPRRLFPNYAAPNVRSSYHFQPRKNWMNDPNGPMFYAGYYHLFYQYNPDCPVWGNITWGHAVSKDMVNWIHLPIALQRDQWYDRNGCWSGSATILPTGKPVIAYTGNSDSNEQLQNLAYPKNLSDPFLVEWVKPDVNPISTTPLQVNTSQYRDPSTPWQGKDGVWRMVVGARRVNGADVVLVLKSKDFVNWVVSETPLFSISNRPGAWECPDFYPVSLKSSDGLDTGYNSADSLHVIKASFDDVRADFYAIGTYNEEPDSWSKLQNGFDITSGLKYDHGVFYASKTFFDPQKQRRVLWGWVPELDTAADDYSKDWASLQAIPRTISLDIATGIHLLQTPIEELKSLRTNRIAVSSLQLQGGQQSQLLGVSGCQADLEMKFDISSREAGDTGPFGVTVLASADLKEATHIYFRPIVQGEAEAFQVIMNLSMSSIRPEVEKPAFAAVVRTVKNGILELRVLVDNTIVEVFAQGGEVAITGRVYPTIAVGAQAQLHLFNNGSSPVIVSRVEAWTMRSAVFQNKG